MAGQRAAALGGLPGHQSTVDGGMQFLEEVVDPEPPEPSAAAADDGEAKGPDAKCGTSNKWTRLFTQPEQEESEETVNGAKGDLAKLLLLIDAATGFNGLSRLAMLWTIRHRWPKMTRFAFNVYLHQRRLYVQRVCLISLVILSMDGVTQGNPLAMALYGITLLPLIKHLRSKFPQVLQPWYVDDGAMRGGSRGVAACFQEMCRIGPQYNYFPEPENLGRCAPKRNSRSFNGYSLPPNSR